MPTAPKAPTIRIVGPGRAGSALGEALDGAGWSVAPLLGRRDDLAGAAAGVDLLILAVPDAALGDVAAHVEPDPSTVVAHMAGALTLEPLAPHPRRASMHPLVPLPPPPRGARLLLGATWAVAGEAIARRVVSDLGGTAIEVADADRARYHAAAAIAANHLVGLLGQVERVAHGAGVPLSAYLGLARAALDSVDRVGPAAALTGPAARGDDSTLAAHLEALEPEERPAYLAGVELCRRLMTS